MTELTSSLPKLLEMPAPHYVLFTSGNRPNSDVPWCPDCALTLPAIRRVVHLVGGSLLEVDVGSLPEWKSPQHPLRQDPQLRLKNIPTLQHWIKGGPAAALRADVINRDVSEQEVHLEVAKFIKLTAGAASKFVSQTTTDLIAQNGALDAATVDASMQQSE
eukprot:gene21656-28672_t